MAPVTGTYTLLVTDGGSSFPNSGDYEVHYVRAPGANEHGSLSTGSTISGFIDLGDLDTFTFTVNAGSSIEIEVVDLASTFLDPQATIYDPNGAYVTYGWGSEVATVAFTAATTGTYTLLVTDGGSSFPNTGAYGVRLEGGAGEGYCFGDSAAAGCPCDAFGSAGEGCANSAGQGTRLAASGSASLSSDSFQLHVSGVPGSKPGLILVGANQLNGGLGNPVGDGLLCLGGQTARSQVQLTSAGSTSFDNFQGSPFGAASFGAGVPTNYQFWFRDAGNTCSGAGFNFSNAWTVTWLP